MGGVKKKSLASMEKTQESQDEGEGQTSKGRKAKEAKGAPQQRKQYAFLLPRMSDADMIKALTPLKAITTNAACRALGVNASIANTVLRDLESKQLLRKAGGFSGHVVWALKG